MKQLLAIALTTVMFLFSALPIAQAADLEGSMPNSSEPNSGAQVFEINCAGCHANGGNIVRRGKNLKLKTLQKNQMDSLEAISAIVKQGKNNMSAYGDRLTPTQIEDVATYVLQQAEAGWK